MRLKHLSSFYTEQNEHINQLLKPLSKHAEEAQESEDAGRLPVRLDCIGSDLAEAGGCTGQDRSASISHCQLLLGCPADLRCGKLAVIVLLW